MTIVLRFKFPFHSLISYFLRLLIGPEMTFSVSAVLRRYWGNYRQSRDWWQWERVYRVAKWSAPDEEASLRITVVNSWPDLYRGRPLDVLISRSHKWISIMTSVCGYLILLRSTFVKSRIAGWCVMVGVDKTVRIIIRRNKETGACFCVVNML